MNLRPATPPDCWHLAKNLRSCDRQEIALGSGRNPYNVLCDALRGSDICEAIVSPDGTLAGIWGVCPLPSQQGTGSIWMLASDSLESIPTSFLRACRPAIAQAHTLYPTLACAPWRENALHRQWLEWLGFTALDAGHPHFITYQRHV